MDDATEEAFDALAQNTVNSAASIKCSISDYIDGLKMIREQINTSIECAESDLRQQNKG